MLRRSALWSYERMQPSAASCTPSARALCLGCCAFAARSQATRGEPEQGGGFRCLFPIVHCGCSLLLLAAMLTVSLPIALLPTKSDQGGRQRQHCGQLLQDVWLRLRHRIQQRGHRVVSTNWVGWLLWDGVMASRSRDRNLGAALF